jgi:4-hydroxy-3-methylbut-2-enyl diphosphate reductase
MGPERAGAAARTALTTWPGLPVAVVGVAGGTTDDLAPGQLVVATEVAGPDGHGLACPGGAPLAAALRRRGIPAHLGPVASVDHLARRDERGALARTGAVAIDMESSVLAKAAVEAGRAVCVLRVVVDTPSRGLHRPVATLTGGIRALRALRRAAPALDEWAEAAGPRTVLLAGPRSFCAGVERAIEIVERALAAYGPPVYVRKQIVHNVHVVKDLEDRGAVFVDEVTDVPTGALAVFSAHGVSPQVREQAASRELRIIDATCPLVTKVHTEARRFARNGYTTILIGHEGHEEVEGTTGEAPSSTRLIGTADEVATLRAGDGERFAYLTQTTLAVDEVQDVVEALRERFPGLVGPGSDDICYATSNRQDAVKALAGECDLLLVIGSTNSSNSKRLVEVSERLGCPARLLDDETELDPAWLAGVHTVGVTAGASAPESLVTRVVDALAGLGPVAVHERHVVQESLQFTLPIELRTMDRSNAGRR